jgi:archaellum biogenesis protein FlaJ (TadC family)
MVFSRLKRKKESKVKKEKFIKKYQKFSFKVLGKIVPKKSKYEQLVLKLKMANMPITPEVYISTILLTGILFSFVSFIVYYFLFRFVFHSGSWLMFVLGLTALTGIISFFFFPFVVSSKISHRKTFIDRELPFTLSELSIFASTGLTPIKIFRNMIQRDEETPITAEFKKIIYKIDVEGKDIITSISETAKETPSESLRETLWDIGNMIHQGGDLDI